MLNDIKNFLKDTSTSELSLSMQPLQSIIEVMSELGFPEDLYEYETNGWQCDFWLTYVKPDYPYTLTLTGSLFYGGFCLTKDLITE